MRIRQTVLACVLAMNALSPAALYAQIPASLIPDKTMLLEQAKKLVAELTAMKQDPKLAPSDRDKAGALLPQANAVSSELAKPQAEPGRLAQLAGQLGDLQKQVGALKGVVR